MKLPAAVVLSFNGFVLSKEPEFFLKHGHFGGVAHHEIQVVEPEISVLPVSTEVSQVAELPVLAEVSKEEPETWVVQTYEEPQPELFEVAEAEIEVGEPEIEVGEPEIEVAEPEIEVVEAPNAWTGHSWFHHGHHGKHFSKHHHVKPTLAPTTTTTAPATSSTSTTWTWTRTYPPIHPTVRPPICGPCWLPGPCGSQCVSPPGYSQAHAKVFSGYSKSYSKGKHHHH